MEWILIAYFVIINILAVYATIHDKKSAIKHKWRVPESTLLILAAISGCVVMYITMRIIHHKTKKLKFMLGIPVIFVLEVLAVFCVKVLIS
ncbi:MAG: DUF1294 domain-containing protein [Candidatus Pseudoruminococcus sp.]|uniref:DUF1294 domain-containing protein n=1 Tax=Candidatus Pseudoruminococcus sp. TaxID=3101048 RepID=UPI002A7CB8F2|nr:DUF1294 domain-containing protein [Ruminococcus sp.]MDY2782409.1 DUF1294 domain-containing protein [Candidatus Pseudoruminococcus sp.]